MKSTKVIYLLESVNTEDYTGVLKTKPEYPKNGPWHTINVKLSGLLNALVKDDDVKGLMIGDKLVGTKFCSDVNSSSYAENPFKLVEFIPTKKSDVPRNFMLKLVNQTKGTREEIIDLYANKFEIWHNKKRIFQSKYFKRYEQVLSDALMKDMEYKIIEP